MVVLAGAALCCAIGSMGGSSMLGLNGSARLDGRRNDDKEDDASKQMFAPQPMAARCTAETLQNVE